MKNKRWIWIILLGILIAACLEGNAAFRAAKRGIGLAERIIALTPDSISGYAVADNFHLVTGDSPRMTFAPGQEMGYVDLYFIDPLPVDTEVQLYYKTGGEQDGQDYDRFKCISRYLMKGTKKGRIYFKPGTGHQFRLDIRGNFVLDRIEGGIAVPSDELSFERVADRVKWQRFLALAVLSALCIMPFFTRERKAREESKSRSRVLYMDAVRGIAALFVIGVHVIEPVSLGVPVNTPLGYFLNGAVMLFLTCNLLFFFLSGALLLPYREENLGAFFRKRMSKVVLPLIIYAFLYLWYFCASVTDVTVWFAHALRAILNGQINYGPHLWLVYELIGAYLLVVPFRHMLRHMTERTEKHMTILILALLTVNTVCAFFGLKIGFPLYFGGWGGILLLGYFLSRPWMRRYDGYLLAGGVVSFAVSLWLSGVRTDFKGIVCNCSILMGLMSSAVVVVFLRGEHFLLPFRRIAAALSRHSYSILLVHMFALNSIVFNGLFSSELTKGAQVILPIGFCLFFSFLISAVVDHTVLAAVSQAMKRSKTLYKTLWKTR